MAKLQKNIVIQLTLTALFFLSVTIIADRFMRGARLDLTEDQLYTLTDGTKKMLSSMDEQVTMEFYFSRTLVAPYPQLLSYGKRVEDMLRALAVSSDGNIKLSVVDPVPFSEIEDEAVAAGLKGIPLENGSSIYMGLKVANDIDGEAVIPFFVAERENFLEYDLVKLLVTLDDKSRKTLSLLTSLPMQFGVGGAQAALSGRSQPYVLYQQLAEFFDVQTLSPNFTEITAETDVLLIVHPPHLTDDQLFQIDQYVLKGGRALIFLDPHSEAVDPRSQAVNSSNLGPLLAAWGVDMPSDKVVGDASLAQRVQVAGVGPDAIKDYVFWLGVRGEEFLVADDVVSGTIDTLNVATSGVLSKMEGATTKFTPIVTTSAVAMLYDASRAAGQPNPDELLRDFSASGETYTLVARINGQSKTAFPQKVIEVSGPTPNLAVEEGTINIVLGADTDLFEDRFWVQLQDLLGQRVVVPLAGNGSFIMNLADHISGSDLLLGLRGRGVSKRPFDVVDKLRREAETKYLAEEQILQDQMQVTEQRLLELETQNPDGSVIYSSAQQTEIESFRDQLLQTRKDLRAVNRSLHEEIDGLGKWLTFLNIVLVPLIIVFIVLIRVIVRQRKARLRQ